MKGNTITLVAAAAAASVAFIGTETNGQAPGEVYCSCSANCTASGDPEITPFLSDHKTTLSDPNELMYQMGDWTVELTVDSGTRITEVNFGGVIYSKDNCESEETSWKDVYEDKNYGKVDITIECALYHSYYHLNIDLMKSDTSQAADSDQAPDFSTFEADIGSSGFCVGGQSRLLRGRKLTAGETCSCSASCYMYGDPHVTSFYNKNEKITSNDLETIYSQDDFTITATVTNSYIRNVTFGGYETLSAAELCTSTHINQNYTQSFGSLGYLTMIAQCDNVGSAHGFFFDLFITKYDYADQADATTESFQTMEESQSTGGLCELTRN